MNGHTSGRKALAFIFVTILLDTIGFGIMIPVLPKLIVRLTGEGLSKAAVYGGWLLFLYALMQFVCGPVLGNLSDRFGRRPVLLTSLFAFGVDYLLMALAPSLGWLFVGRFLSGIAGATYATANAYVADITPAETRAQSFGLLGAAWGLGFIVGPVLGGLLGGLGPRMPFFAAAALAFLNVVYGLFLLPESLAPEARRPFTWKRANLFGALSRMRREPVLAGLAGVILLYQIAHDVSPSTWSFYTMLKFGWSEREVGLSLGAIGVLIAIVQGGLIRVLMPALGARRAVHAGLLAMAVACAGLAFATQGWMAYALLLPLSFSGLAMPALQSILSSRVAADEQGELQGAVTSLISLTAIVAPVLMTHLFEYFSAREAPVYFPGAPYFAATLLLAGSLGLFRRASVESGA